MSRISLNSDLGEGFGAWRIADDDALLAVVTDANIACGFHAGDPSIMRQTFGRARERGLGVGAHVGFFDLRGFGRSTIDLDAQVVMNDVIYQIGASAAFAAAEGLRLTYVKPHGALYHAALKRPDHCDAIVEAVRLVDPSLAIMGQPGTPLAVAARVAGIGWFAEGFLDRAYTHEGLLVPRGRPGALVTDLAEVVRRGVRMATEGVVEAIDGTVVEVDVDTLCIHSDSPGAPEIARAVRAALVEAEVEVCPLARAR